MNKEYVLIDSSQFQQKVLDCVGSQEIDKYFDSTIFAKLPESKMYKQAMVHGMVIASMMTSLCNQIIIKGG